MSIKVKQNGIWWEVGSKLELDSSLSIAGKAADAKAVGDALDNITVEVDPTLAVSGKAADAKAVGDALNTTKETLDNLPIKVADDGFTDLTNLRQVINIQINKSDNKIQMDLKLEGDVTSQSVITLDENGYPSNIATDGIECVITWTGFDT